MSRDDILHRLRQHKRELAQRFGVKTLQLFGSYVRGQESSGSDVDILVEFDEPPGMFDFVRLEIALSDLLGMKVDLVMKDALRPGIGEQIRREAVSVWARPGSSWTICETSTTPFRRPRRFSRA